jgi:hypothetical protein
MHVHRNVGAYGHYILDLPLILRLRPTVFEVLLLRDIRTGKPLRSGYSKMIR